MVDHPLVGRLVRMVFWDWSGRVGVLVCCWQVCWRDVFPFLCGDVCAGVEWGDSYSFSVYLSVIVVVYCCGGWWSRVACCMVCLCRVVACVYGVLWPGGRWEVSVYVNSNVCISVW